MTFDLIAFDADDTLWESEIYYQQTQAAFAELLMPYGVDNQAALQVLHHIEMANLAPFGYGIKGFVLSMVEAAVEITQGKVKGEDIRTIVDFGRRMTTHDMQVLEHAAGTVARLAETHRLMLLTKGDLMDQERKITASGLSPYFPQVEIVSDKTPEVYAALLKKYNLDPKRFLMVGNSMRSDILPVLALGGYAVYVPHQLTWVHEHGEAPASMDGRFHEIDHLGLLPDLIDRLEQAA